MDGEDGEDQGMPGRDAGDEMGDESGPDRMLGWIPPDDRLWRHPSESGLTPFGPSTGLAVSSGSRARLRTGFWVVSGATCVLVTLMTAGLIMTTAGSSNQDGMTSMPHVASLASAPTTEPGVKGVQGVASIEAMVASIRPSTVVLRIDKPGGETIETGLVVESGGIIVTAAQALSGATSITAMEADGTQRTAQLLGTDKPTGLSVVRIADDLPAASFDNGDLPTGATAIAMALELGRHDDSVPTPVVYAGTVVSVGSALDLDSVTTLFAATAVEAPLSRDDLGCPLLDEDGNVSGLLEVSQQSGTSTTSVFLPAELVLGVAEQLVTRGSVDHGWLGVAASDSVPSASPTIIDTTTNPTDATASSSPVVGARLDAINDDSPAADGGLEPGDVITAIDRSPVHSNVELQTRLYGEPPGAELEVTYVRGGITMSTWVMLADGDPDAPESDASS